MTIHTIVENETFRKMMFWLEKNTSATYEESGASPITQVHLVARGDVIVRLSDRGIATIVPISSDHPLQDRGEMVRAKALAAEARRRWPK